MSIETEYKELKPIAESFLSEFKHQLEVLFEREQISLAVPLEARFKSWESISEKIERKSLSIGKIMEIPDLLGIRIILLFERDAKKVITFLKSHCKIIKEEDKGGFLSEREFGYQSKHLDVRLSNDWAKVPSLAEGKDLPIEIQVRTMAQHIWAAISHKLQYKQEKNTPITLRRSINRAAALLETVDLEFERVLSERESYIQSVEITEDTAELDIELVKRVMDEILPEKNKDSNEGYDEVLTELKYCGVTTVGQLKQLLLKHKETVLAKDLATVEERRKEKSTLGTSPERTEKGVYYTHAGLTRVTLVDEFGDRYRKYQNEKPRVSPGKMK